MPRVEIVLSRGAPEEEEILRAFRRRHPRYRIVSRKSVGAALLPLDEFTTLEEYLANLRYARRRVRRAARLGYTVGFFDPNKRRSELLSIHTSLPERQGRAIDPEYLDPGAEYPAGPHIEYHGAFQRDVLVAYSRVEYAGDIAALARIMGHGDHMDDGTMFLLVRGSWSTSRRSAPRRATSSTTCSSAPPTDFVSSRRTWDFDPISCAGRTSRSGWEPPRRGEARLPDHDGPSRL